MASAYEPPSVVMLGSLGDLTKGIKPSWGNDCNFPNSPFEEWVCWGGGS